MATSTLALYVLASIGALCLFCSTLIALALAVIGLHHLVGRHVEARALVRETEAALQREAQR